MKIRSFEFNLRELAGAMERFSRWQLDILQSAGSTLRDSL